MCACMLSHFVTCQDMRRLLCPWDSPSQEYWSGLPLNELFNIPTRDLLNPGIKPCLLHCRGGFFALLKHFRKARCPPQRILKAKMVEVNKDNIETMVKCRSIQTS